MLDLEREYNNRGLVPDHLAIFDANARDAAAYRVARDGIAEIDVPYGDAPRQRYDLFPVDAPDAPFVLFVHGGYWQAMSKANYSHLAAGPNGRGMTLALAGYTLCPDTTVAGILDEMRRLVVVLAKRFAKPMVVSGHSAGGHLAAALLATDWAGYAPDLGFDPVPAALPISGVFDLAPLVVTSMNVKLGLDVDEARRLSPILWKAPAGKRCVAVVGAEESSEFRRQTRDLAAHWAGAGVAARGVEVPGTNHFTVIAGYAEAESDLTRGLSALTTN
jgi:arylformamidase